MTTPAPAAVAVRVRILPRVPFAAPHATDDHAGRFAKVGAAAKRRKRRRSRRDYDRDEHATAYLSSEDASFLIERWKEGLEGWNGGEVDGRACRLFRTIGRDGHGTSSADGDVDFDEWREGADGRRRLWAPLILRTWPSGGESRNAEGEDAPTAADAPTTAASATKETHTDPNNNDQTRIPTLSVPPCLASTLGMNPFHSVSHQLSSTIECSLQPLPKEALVKATRATLREVGTPPPVPKLKWPASRDTREGGEKNGNGKKSGKDNAKTSGNDEGAGDDGEADEELRWFFLSQPKRIEVDDDERQLHPLCRTQPKTPSKPKPRRRLLALGSIFAVPCYDEDDGRCRDEHWYDADGFRGGRRVHDVRFYQVVDAASAAMKDINDNSGGDSTTNATANDKARRKHIAYVVSPSTHLTLLPSTSSDESWGALHPQLDDVPAREGATWRLPRPSLVKAFVQSIVDAGMAHDRKSHGREVARTSDGGSVRTRGWRHPSAKEMADALYLQGTVPSRTIGASMKECRVCHSRLHRAAAATNHPGPRMVHVVGREENHVRGCVDEAADIMGMRAFHVDGLAAFWAHYHLLGTYSERPSAESHTAAPPLTGGLADKLRGLAASLALARRSSPCVLHICLDGELAVVDGHQADVDARKEEEGRLLEAMREGIPAGGAGWDTDTWCEALVGGAGTGGGGRLVQDLFLSAATAPRVVVVVSTSKPLPPGYPLATSLWHPRIVVGAPDEPYARALWDDDADGTFDCVAPYLRGLSAREVGQLRGEFVSRWEAEIAKARGGDAGADDASAPSPVDVLKGLLPQLEAARAFARSSSQGGSGALPLAPSSLPTVRWEDIGGLDSIRREITDAVELPLRHPALFAGSRRSGLLLFGPPGTGKTLVAKAVARECGLPFVSVKGPELLGSYVGESEANVRAVFDAARAAARDPPASSWTEGRVGREEDVDGSAGGYAGASVLFFDELDSLAPRRGDTGHGDGVMDRVVATLLGELDGGSGGDGRRSDAHVIVIGATNRPDLLDPSLLRPGRFDRLLYLGPAKTREDCLQILLAQTRKFRFEHGQDARAVLERAMESFPPALSGADLSAVASGALMRGLQRVCARVEEEVRLINAQRGQDSDGPEYAVDIDDVMGSWSKEDLQPTMTAEDFTEAAKTIVPSISQQDLDSFERLQLQYSSGQYT